MKWNLPAVNRRAAEAELRKQGKSIKDYPWPEDGPVVSRLTSRECLLSGVSGHDCLRHGHNGQTCLDD